MTCSAVGGLVQSIRSEQLKEIDTVYKLYIRVFHINCSSGRLDLHLERVQRVAEDRGQGRADLHQGHQQEEEARRSVRECRSVEDHFDRGSQY